MDSDKVLDMDVGQEEFGLLMASEYILQYDHGIIQWIKE